MPLDIVKSASRRELDSLSDSAHLRFRHANPETGRPEFAGLRGTTIQWIFNRSKVTGSPGHAYSLVLSGAHKHIQTSKDRLLEIALHDLEQLFPATRDARLLHSLIIKERFATFSPGVGIDAVRPAAKSPIRGLYLAGDWTATGLPATIEGAVKSGHQAAQLILNRIS